MQANERELIDLIWNIRTAIEQLGAVISSANELKCFEASLGGDFDRVRVLLELSQDLVAQAGQSALQLEHATGLPASQAMETEGVRLPHHFVMTLLKRIEDYLRHDGGAHSLAAAATAIATHSKSDKNAMQLVTFIVGMLQEGGVQAELVAFPNGPQVVVWNSDSAEVWNAKVAAGLL